MRVVYGLRMFTPEELECLNREPKIKGTKPSLASLEKLYGELQSFNHQALPSIPFQFRSKLPSVTGVYLLYLGNDVYYVGQSKNVSDRWQSHDVLDKLALASEVLTSADLRIGWIEVPKQLLNFAEIYLIGLYQPFLNIAHRDSHTTV